MTKAKYIVTNLPPKIELETKRILKKTARAHRYLAELKGMALTIPNEAILLNTLVLQEAKDSSEVENIITTHDELYKAELFGTSTTAAAKEVRRYASALRKGFEIVCEKGLLTTNTIKEIYTELEKNTRGFRKKPGTQLRNLTTGEVVYTPPQTHDAIVTLMDNLEQFINADSNDEIDPLVRMAVIHFQFESIHPFYDGNGRTGRIINILYLVMKDLLDIPILYLSRYFIRHKKLYYSSLQNVRDNDDWETWILFVLEAVEKTSIQTINVITNIKNLILRYKHEIREKLPKIYSQDLLNNLFKHPYTKIAFLRNDLKVTRLTATRYLDKLVAEGFLKKEKIGKHNYYINTPLTNLLLDVPEV